METQTQSSNVEEGKGRGANGKGAQAASEPRSAVAMFRERAAASGARTALRRKVAGNWVPSTWADWDTASREIAAGLIAAGLQPGDRACVLAQTRMEWPWCDVGILMAGGVTVPIYPSNTPDQCEYIIVDSGARVVIADDPAQLEKLFQPDVLKSLGNVARFVYFDAETRFEKPDRKGRLALKLDDAVPAAERGRVQSLDDLRAAGRALLAQQPGALDERSERLKPDDVFTIVYTSGTTGPPKGVVLTHGNICFECASVDDILPISEDDEQLLFLPLAHIFAKILMWVAIRRGFSTAFAEGIPQVAANMKEVRPSFMGSVPRIYEKVYGKVVSGAAEAGGLKKTIFDWAVATGRKVSALKQRGEPIPGLLQLKFNLADKLVFSKLKAAFGGRLRFFISGGAPLSKEIAEFFHAAGVLILEGYGLTETTAATHVNRPDRYRFGTVGPAIPGVEVKIAGDGEILVRGRNILREYFGKPEATREAIDEQGWFHTGDIGVEEDGLLRITDRKKDIIVTAGGKNIAPQNIENALKAICPLISQAMVYGDKKPFLVGLVTISEENVVAWAKDRGIAGSYAELTRNAEVLRVVAEAMKTLNGRLASYESVKKYEVLDHDFTQDAGELTPTLKVKRKFCSDKYMERIESLYA